LKRYQYDVSCETSRLLRVSWRVGCRSISFCWCKQIWTMDLPPFWYHRT
jgi:hypothetical protein